MNDFGNGVQAVVMFHFSAQFWRKQELPEQLPPLYGGALTCPVATADLASLSPDFSPATLAFGSFQLGEHPILEMTFSVGDLKVRWLADAKDLEVWENLHLWKKWEVLPVVVGVEQGGTWAYRFYSPEIPDLPPMPGELVNYRNVWDEPEPWASMVEYVKDHPDAYPVMSNRVPSLPTPDDFAGLKVVLSPGGC
ncbi:hypothetical protein [Cupriavidus sp. D384]|uniref:hypothetical protein n=1 Tax=Cupriavidus sp. D384 TaxID=1538095 RepID=UPI00082AF220|nr:hypothetical protein [Cupriavidus sp. D384]